METPGPKLTKKQINNEIAKALKVNEQMKNQHYGTPMPSSGAGGKHPIEAGYGEDKSWPQG